MEKIKRFIDIYVPITSCTLRCHYCYITHHHLFDKKLPQFKYDAEFIRKAFSKERFGGVCLINMCGDGETLLPPEMIKYIRVLLEEGHYVMVVTNATTTKRFEEIAKFPKELKERLFFKFSYHYLELKKRNLLDIFFSNIKKMRDEGCSFTLEATPSDELIPYIDEMKERAIKEVGAINHMTIARDERRKAEFLPILTNMSLENYKKTWGDFNSSFFNYKMSIFGIKRKEFCYAGAWSLHVNLGNGNASQCYCSYVKQNIYKDITKPIKFIPVGNNCNQHHCYNGHVFLTLGNIPELQAPNYADIRNKVTLDGSEWLQPKMKAFMSSKLYESNKEYTQEEKDKWNRYIRIRKIKTDIKHFLVKKTSKIRHGLSNKN